MHTVSSNSLGDGPSRETTKKRALLIVNGESRSAGAQSASAVDLLRKAGFDIIAPRVGSREAAAQAVREHRTVADLVVCAGGDGTLNAVLQGLAGTDLPLGILPLGTANDLAKTLGLPQDLAAACEVIGRGFERRIDVARVNDAYYFNEASIGLSVTLCRTLTTKAKARFGVFAILFQVFAIMRRMRRFAAYVSCDGQPEVRLNAAQITFGNSRNFGGVVASDEASIEDRLLDLYCVEFKHWWSYLEAVLSLLRRRYDEAASVFTLHARRFDVRTRRALPIEADGEILARTPATFEIVSERLRVFVPGPGAGSSA